MSLRRTLTSLLTAPATRVLRRDIRDIVEQALAARSFVTPSELHALERKVAGLGGAPAPDPRIAALEERLAQVEKRLSMAMGAVQAGSATVTQARGIADEALSIARRAEQIATTARATAEAAADGVSALEDHQPAASADRPSPADEHCRVPDCGARHRAKGFCARHYQQWRRSGLEGFVSLDGAVQIPGAGGWRVAADFAGQRASWTHGRLLVDGRDVEATPLGRV
jgi:hypothetical protein